MKLYFIPLLFLIACSGAQPYERGTVPVSPVVQPSRPVYTPNGAGMREVRPGVQPLPRSSNKRILPPSKEPGLWSADRPRAAKEQHPKPTSKPELFGLPMAITDNPDKDTKFTAGFCSQTVERETQNHGTHGQIMDMSLKERSCFAAFVYSACVSRARAVAETKVSSGLPAEKELAAMKALDAKAEAAKNRACGKGEPSDALKTYTEHLINGLFEEELIQ